MIDKLITGLINLLVIIRQWSRRCAVCGLWMRSVEVTGQCTRCGGWFCSSHTAAALGNLVGHPICTECYWRATNEELREA